MNLPAPRLSTPRYLSIDVARGVIMIVMALDHASVAWNSGRSMFEAGLPPIEAVSYTSITQQIVREVTHICAPGFQLLAGVGLAISVRRRQLAGAGELYISGDMILRAAVLFFCEWVLLHVPMGQGWFFFAVLCSIGSAMIIFAVARFLPWWLIAAGSFGVLLGAPAYCPEAIIEPSAAAYLRNVWTSIVLTGQGDPGQVLYPILPWVGFFGIGWCLGSLYERRSAARRGWLPLAGLGVVALGVLLRWFGGSYGDRVPGGGAGPASAAFWILAKYPPTPAFSMTTLGLVVALLGVLRPIDRAERPGRWWRAVAVYGQVPLFFYLVHIYLYGAYPFTTNTLAGYSLRTTFIVWIVGLAVLWPVCAWYAKARRRYRRVLRYW